MSHTEGIALPKPLRFSLIVSLAVTALSPGLSAQTPPDTLPRRLTVRRNVLTPDLGQLCRVEVAANFVYAGGQRFILQSVADAEQHFFVNADSSRTIRDAFWVQRESLLPGQSGGYTYDADSTRTVGGLLWKVDLRTNRGSPRPGSDGAAAVEFLLRSGYRFPPLAPRLRLVYLPVVGGPDELMIIYWSSLSSALPDTSLAATLRRVNRSLAVTACR